MSNLTKSLTDFSELEQQALLALKQQVSKVFVTGAGGFLGYAICERLNAAGIETVGFARNQYSSLTDLGINSVQGDIANLQQVTGAMQGCDLVFHVASKAGVWGSKQSYFSPNVDGASNIINACQALGIKSLVYTSTPSVTFSGEDENGIDESAPYAHTFLNHYGESKARAEKMMLNANSASLKVTALRPHLIWGPNDPHLVPRVIERAKAGKLKLVGKQDKLVDTIFIDNAAYAHILAAVDLTQTAKSAGKAYFLSNDQPITMAQMLNKILACVDLPPVNKRVPAKLAYGVGVLLETIYGALNKQQEPIMTRFVAKQLSTSHYFNISAAKQDLGYQPIVSIDDGMEKLAQYLAK
ncbi:2-alkyl-3-oxoalkanoate reductase [Shewanella gaetbuli]